MTRTSSDDWISAGIALLREGGNEALTVDRLCTALHRTKGAFYHHFLDIAGYHSALLQRWAALHTELPIQESHGDSERLYRAVGKVDLGLELAVHAWAVRSPVARAATEQVHKRRLAYLTKLLGSRDRAELEYATFVGAMHVYPDQPAKRLRLHRQLKALRP